MSIRLLPRPRFEALLYRRQPWTEMIVEEKEWWSNETETVIGFVALDRIDHDFSWVVLGRDETGVFRAIDLRVSLSSIEIARANLHERLTTLSATNDQEFPQGDNNRKKHEILVPHPKVAAERLNPRFRYLIDQANYSPARGLIKELSFAFKDRDGNYRRDFQTTGFDGRLWELYLYALLYEQKFAIDDEHSIPDFIVEKFGHRIAIEGVTVNPTPGAEIPQPKNKEEEFALSEGYMPIKWGSPLFSKLTKEYWKRKQIAGLPLVFAVHDFHGPGTMVWSLPSLSDYLFGVRGHESGRDVPITEHVYRDKKIPSGFFKLPGAANISAVIASNEATLPKFNRMGKIAGFGDSNINMRRIGAQLDLATLAVGPFETVTEVGVPNESWVSNTWIYHNPNAKTPLDPELFEGAINVFLQEGERVTVSTSRIHVLRSVTRMS